MKMGRNMKRLCFIFASRLQYASDLVCKIEIPLLFVILLDSAQILLYRKILGDIAFLQFSYEHNNKAKYGIFKKLEFNAESGNIVLRLQTAAFIGEQ